MPFVCDMKLKFGNKMAKNGKKMPENCEIFNFGLRKSRKKSYFGYNTNYSSYINTLDHTN